MGTVNVQFDIEPGSFIKEVAHQMNSMNSESASSILAALAKDHLLHCLDNLIKKGDAIRYQQMQGITKNAVAHQSLKELQSTPTPIGHFDVTLCQDRKEDRLDLVPVLPENLRVESNGGVFRNNGNGSPMQSIMLVGTLTPPPTHLR